MPTKRDASCPLCGARMQPRELLEACSGLQDGDLGVLAARCPYCQGYLELRPCAGQLEIGYLVGKDQPRFEVALVLPYPGLEVERQDGALALRAPDGTWAWSD